MIWNDHSKDFPDGSHGFLSASQSAWVNDEYEDLEKRYLARYAADVGTCVHAWAAAHIKNMVRVKNAAKDELYLHLVEQGFPRNAFDIDNIFATTQLYVNDSIQRRLRPEQKLKYSELAKGTADAINYTEKTNRLIIHDLKTGAGQVSMRQLLVYAAFFVLEYEDQIEDVKNMDIELRIYQKGDYEEAHPTYEDLSELIGIVKEKNEWAEDIYAAGR